MDDCQSASMYLTTVITVVLLFCLLFATSLSDQSQDGVLTIQVQKKDMKLKPLISHIKAVKTKTRSGAIELKDVQDQYYYGQIQVGTPPQNIFVDFDTGSAELWIASSKICNSDPPYCNRHRTYNHCKSKTYKPNWKPINITYGIGYASGFVSQDSIKLGTLEVKDQLFVEVTDMDEDLRTSEISEGILGMAYPRKSRIKGGDPPFFNLIKQNAFVQPVFAFYLNKLSSGNHSTGELVLGGVDPEHYTGDFVFAPVEFPGYWSFTVDSLYLENKKLFDNYTAVLDTGSTMIYGPSSVINPIIEAIGGQPIQEEDYQVDCSKIDSFPDVYITISEQKLVMHGRDYIRKVTDDGKHTICISGFLPLDECPFYILGDMFLRKYYTQFDVGNHRVGFALAK